VLGISDGLEADHPAENEFGGAPLGDARLSKRLVNMAKAKAEVPNRSFSGVAKGDWPAVKAYYRMIDHPDDSAVNMTNILVPHQERTMRRMQGQKRVLCIQDGSDLNYTNLDQCEGLGVIGTNQTGSKSRGLHLHSTFTVAPNGLPLGVLKAQRLALEGKSPEDNRSASVIPIEEKKTFAWIEHHQQSVEMAASMPNIRLTNVCDREADFIEMFEKQHQNPHVELLVRAKNNRNIIQESFKQFTAVSQEPVHGWVWVHIPQQTARPKRSKQKGNRKKLGVLQILRFAISRFNFVLYTIIADKDIL